MSLARLAVILANLDAALAPGRYFFGGQPTACDICLATQATWPIIFPGAIDDIANLKRSVQAAVERPADARVMRKAHGRPGANGVRLDHEHETCVPGDDAASIAASYHRTIAWREQLWDQFQRDGTLSFAPPPDP